MAMYITPLTVRVMRRAMARLDLDPDTEIEVVDERGRPLIVTELESNVDGSRSHVRLHVRRPGG